jgi:hypothetical protein
VGHLCQVVEWGPHISSMGPACQHGGVGPTCQDGGGISGHWSLGRLYSLT